MTARNTSAEHKKNFIGNKTKDKITTFCNKTKLKPMSVIQIIAPIVVLIVTLYFGRDLMKEEDWVVNAIQNINL